MLLGIILIILLVALAIGGAIYSDKESYGDLLK